MASAFLPLPQEKLDIIQKDAQRTQKLARELSTTSSFSEARRIRREMARISQEILENLEAVDG